MLDFRDPDYDSIHISSVDLIIQNVTKRPLIYKGHAINFNDQKNVNKAIAVAKKATQKT